MVVNGEYLMACVTGLFLHEAGHICLARGLGLQIKRIGLSWWGPYIVRETGSPAVDAMVSASGPLVNLMLAAITWGHWPTFAVVNLVLGTTNLLPLPKCDGGRILRALSLAGKSLERKSDTPTPAVTVPHLDLSV
jgi:Zn-dependent protease